MILFISTLLFSPFGLHPAIGFILKLLSGGNRRGALLLSFFAGLFYDLSINHLPFGWVTLIWMFSTCVVEAFRRLFFFGKVKELLLGTMLFSFVLEATQGIFLGYFKASLSFQPVWESVVALSLVWGVPFAIKLLKARRLRSART